MRIPAAFATKACVLLTCIFGTSPIRTVQAQQQGSAVNPPATTAVETAPPHFKNLTEGKLLHMVQPVYPEAARRAHVSGTVVVHAIIAADGSIKQLHYISGPAPLKEAAMDAVKQWQYKPYMLNGEPVDVDTTISVVFKLDSGKDASTAERSADAQNPGSLKNSANAPAAAAPETPIDPQFKANIVKLLDVTHALALGQQAAKAMLAQMRPTLVASLPPTPHREQIVDAYAAKLTALLSSQEVADRLAAVYARHLSPDDVSSMIQFYQTPAGQHALASMPQVLAESQQIGSNAAQENLPRIFGELCTEFPELRGKVKFCPATTKNESSERMERQWPGVSAQQKGSDE